MTKYFIFPSFIMVYLIMISFSTVYSQSKAGAPIDSTLTMAVEEPNKISIIIQRSLMLQSNKDETAPVSSISGAWYMGLGFKFPFAKNRFGFRIQPGATWVKLTYDQSKSTKNFPDSLSHNSQKHRLTYAELPIGLYYNFTLDKERNAKVFLEAGGFVGINTGGIHKYVDNNILDQPVKTKISAIQDVEPLRYGVYGRFGYKFFAVTVTNRLTDLFVKDRTDLNKEVIGVNPIFSRTQIGITIFI